MGLLRNLTEKWHNRNWRRRPSNMPEPGWIYKTHPAQETLSVWLQQADGIAAAMTQRDLHDTNAPFVASNALTLIFPLAEAAGQRNGLTGYLRSLGFAGGEAEQIKLIFRNGIVHSNKPRVIKYDDGPVSWEIHASTHVGDAPTLLPATNSEEVLTYYDIGGTWKYNLNVDKLLRLMRQDLNDRLTAATAQDTIEVVAGVRIGGNRPRKGLRRLHQPSDITRPDAWTRHPDGKRRR